jgi:hypothetical protein
MQLIYQQKSYEAHAKDHEFSATSMHEHWQSGYEDTKRTLTQRHWLEMPDPVGPSSCMMCIASRIDPRARSLKR